MSAASYNVTLTSPSGGAAGRAVGAALRSWRKQLNSPTVWTLELGADWERYEDESSSSNPAQMCARVVVTRTWPGSSAVTLLTGRVNAKRVVEAGGLPRVELDCGCVFDLLNRTLALPDGASAVGSLKSATAVAVTNVTLEQWHSTAPYDRYFQPAVTHASWRPLAGNYAVEDTTIGAGGMTNVATSHELSRPDDECFPRAGLAYITGANLEVVVFDGYDQTTWDTSNMYMRNLLRGALGTAAAAHSSGDGVNAIEHKGFDRDATLTVEGNDGGVWTVIDSGEYSVDYERGLVVFNTDPLATPPAPLSACSAVRASFTYFDLGTSSAGIYTLGDPAGSQEGAIETLLEGPTSAGGPGLSSGDYELDLHYCPVRRLDFEQPTTMRQALDSLLESYGPRLLGKRNSDWRVHEVVAYTRHSDGKFVVAELTQNTNNPTRLHGAAVRSRLFSLQDCASAVCVGYTVGGSPASVLVQLSSLDPASNPNDATLLYNSTAATRLVPVHTYDQPTVVVLNIGEATPAAAAGAGRAELLRRLQRFEARDYQLQGVNSTLPEVGSVVRMDDGFTGVLYAAQGSAVDGLEDVSVTVVDFTRRVV